jgi:hypothetical protein
MKKMQSNLVTLKAGLLTLAVGLLMTGCKKATINTNDQQQQEASGATAHTEAINSTFSVNWNGYADGVYTSSQAAADFGNISGWNDSRTWISGGTCRIKLLANALSGAGGVIGNIDISDGSAYELDYDVRFHSQFDFSRGGKIGFGFLVGDGNTGGDPGWDGNGGSLRLMWYQTDAGRVFFQPYVYYKDQPGEYGNSFGKSYPSSGSLNKAQTYHVHMYIKSNTGSNTDGRAEIVIDGTTVLDQAIRWTTNDSKRLIKQLSFHTFRGGSQTYWQSSTDGYIYYDNLSVHKISS